MLLRLLFASVLLACCSGAFAIEEPAWVKMLKGKVKHVIVLMEENRSFECVQTFMTRLGALPFQPLFLLGHQAVACDFGSLQSSAKSTRRDIV
jgi:hypothetical protein